jgi:hypothetical protein
MSSSSNSTAFATAVINLGASMPEAQLSTMIRKIGLDALTGLVNMTPVDTGRSKGNWNVTFNDRGTEPSSDGRMDKTGANSITKGTTDIIAATARNGTPKTIYITNNVPYIEDLENGKSKQAPNGMLRVTTNRLSLTYGVSTSP